MRGAGSYADFYWVPEEVAVNFNGVYLPRFAVLGAFFDMDNVQVLPGPQGVLYGHSASGGAILLNAKMPVFEREAGLTAEYGTHNFIHIEAVGNEPITDTLAVRAAVNFLKHDGYESNGAQAEDSISARLSALYKPSEQLSLQVWGAYFKDTGTPPYATYIPPLSKSNPWYIPAMDPFSGVTNTGAFLDYTYYLAGANAEYDFGPVLLKYSASYLDQTEDSAINLAGVFQSNDNKQRQYGQDLKLSSATNSKLQWIAGLSWLDTKSTSIVLFGERGGTVIPALEQLSESAFAQLTYSIVPDLRLVGGTRYSYDHEKTAQGYIVECPAPPPFGPGGACAYPPENYDVGQSHTDLKGGFEYDLSSHSMLYANVQTGYSPGTFNTFTGPGLNKEVHQQTQLAYTAGDKTTFAQGLLTLDLEGYLYNYKDLIIETLDTVHNQAALYTAPTARVYGAQIISTLRPTDDDVFGLNFAYTHGRYGDEPIAASLPSVGGLQMQDTPDLSATLSYLHRFKLSNGAEVDANISSYLSSSYWGTFNHAGGTIQASYTDTNLSLTYKAAKGWSLGVWTTNVENTAVRAAMSATGLSAPYPTGVAGLGPPREAGVRFNVEL
jgi:iron complex outermembrane receptor protein